MSYYDRPFSKGYYSFPQLDKLDKIAKDAVKGIPESHNRIIEETRQKSRIDYVLAHRRTVKTPYKVGDKVIYTTKDNLSRYRNYPWVVVCFNVGYIVKESNLTYTISYYKNGNSGNRVNKEYVLARTK